LITSLLPTGSASWASTDVQTILNYPEINFLD
jgi:hypothetical protein